MKVVSYLLLFIFVGARADMMGECDMVAFYSELGCKPTPSTDNSTQCPESFTCPDLHPDPKKCYYRGVPYENKDMIPQTQVMNPCSLLCMCDVTDEVSFQCAAVDCVETFDGDMDQCIYTYDLESCCSTGNVCGKDDVAKLKTCEVDGETYKEGQKFYVKNTWKTCICTGEWNGTVDNMSYCKDINCGTEIHFQDKLMKNCAPIVLASDPRGCPIGFQCPSNSSKVLRGINVRNINSQCVFGNLTLGVGDEVTVEDQCLTCSCEVPPYVTCKQGPRKDNETNAC